MKFNWNKASLTFFFGIIISFAIGRIFNDSGYMVTVAVCYVGATIIGELGKK